MIAVYASVNAQTTFGVRAGFNYSTVKSPKSGARIAKMYYTPGFHAGFNAEIPVAEGLYIQPGLLFTSKGHKAKPLDGLTYNEHTYYLEIPVNAVYKLEAGTGNILLGVGPYAAYGLWGRGKYSGEPNDGEITKITFKKNGESTNGTMNYKPFDAGINTLLGYEFPSRFSIQLNTQFGLIDFFDDNSNAFARAIILQNQVLGLSMGYRF